MKFSHMEFSRRLENGRETATFFHLHNADAEDGAATLFRIRTFFEIPKGWSSVLQQLPSH